MTPKSTQKLRKEDDFFVLDGHKDSHFRRLMCLLGSGQVCGNAGASRKRLRNIAQLSHLHYPKAATFEGWMETSSLSGSQRVRKVPERIVGYVDHPAELQARMLISG